MRVLTVKGVRIDDTFAEAFGMRATALIITADSARWARQAALNMTGFATSVIGCGCEAGIDCELPAKRTPDRRPGVRVLLFAVSTTELQKQLQARVAQCVLTSPSSVTRCAISATAGKSPSVLVRSISGAFRSWTANLSAKRQRA